MNKHSLSVLFFLILTLALSACSLNQVETITVSEQNLDYTWRIAALSEGEFNFTRYKYDSDGRLEEIIDYENYDPTIAATTDDLKSVSWVRVLVDKSGNISSVTTSFDDRSTEVVNGHTWRIYSDSFSCTNSYNDHFMIETRKMVFDDIKVTNKYSYDADGKAISCTSETETSVDGEVLKSITNFEFEYEYDSFGNPIIQYEISELGKNITSIYSWEHIHKN